MHDLSGQRDRVINKHQICADKMEFSFQIKQKMKYNLMTDLHNYRKWVYS